jgi:hypothetical protein
VGNEAEHLDFFNKIVHALMNVSESVDFSAGKMRSGRHQILVFRPKGKLVSEGRRIDVRPKSRMLGNILHALPIIIDRVMKFFEALNVILFGNDPFHFFSSKKALCIE